MWTNLCFFGSKKKPVYRFLNYVDPIHSHDTRWFLTLPGCHADDFWVSEVLRRHSERIYLWKTWIFDAKFIDFPMWIQGLAGVESGSKINGSQPPEGAQQATGDQIQQKPSRNFTSGFASPIRGILGGTGSENHENLQIFPKILKIRKFLKIQVPVYTTVVEISTLK